MASAEELRQRITANRLKLRGALEAAAGSWESGDDEVWSARTAAEHCIDREVGLAGIAAAAMRGEAPELRFAQTNHPEVRPALSFATAADALAGLDASGAACDEALNGVEAGGAGGAAVAEDAGGRDAACWLAPRRPRAADREDVAHLCGGGGGDLSDRIASDGARQASDMA